MRPRAARPGALGLFFLSTRSQTGPHAFQQMVRRSMARLKHVLAERAIAETDEGLKRDMNDFINAL